MKWKRVAALVAVAGFVCTALVGVPQVMVSNEEEISMGVYPIPPGDSLEPLVREINDLKRQLRDLQRPTGTQVNERTTSMPSPHADSASVSGMSIPSSLTPLVSVSFAVPDGYSKALVTATAQAIGSNSVGGSAYLYVGARINGDYGPALGLSGSVSPGQSGSAIDIYYKTLDVESGGTITVEASARVAPLGAWAANPGNSVTISAQVIFIR